MGEALPHSQSSPLREWGNTPRTGVKLSANTMPWHHKTSDGTDPWVVTFRLIFRKRGYSCPVEAVNYRTGEKLRTPEDFDRIIELISWHDWPPFAKDKHQPTQKERLF